MSALHSFFVRHPADIILVSLSFVRGFKRLRQALADVLVIPLGLEPRTHSLEGCCSNPTELRNPYICKLRAKLRFFFRLTK